MEPTTRKSTTCVCVSKCVKHEAQGDNGTTCHKTAIPAVATKTQLHEQEQVHNQTRQSSDRRTKNHALQTKTSSLYWRMLMVRRPVKLLQKIHRHNRTGVGSRLQDKAQDKNIDYRKVANAKKYAKVSIAQPEQPWNGFKHKLWNNRQSVSCHYDGNTKRAGKKNAKTVAKIIMQDV